MDLFFWAYCGALFALPIILYKLCLPSANQGREKRTKDWYYALKRILCYRKMETFMNQPVILPEMVPKKPENSWEEDVLVFHGVDLNGNSVYISFACGRTESFQKFAEIMVQVRFSTGRILTLPENVLICSLRKREWRTQILTIIPQLNGNYRLIFNGYLKDISKGNENCPIEHLSFNFLFSRATEQMKYPRFFDKGLFSDAICREQWRDGNWTHKLGNSRGFENFGTIHGTMKSTNFNVDATWNLISHQSRIFGTADRYEVDKEITLFSVFDDGTVMHVKNKRITNPAHGSCHIKYGAVFLPSGFSVPAKETDLPLINFHASLGNMTIHVDTKSCEMKTLLHVKPTSETKYTSGHPDFSWELNNIMAEASIPGSNGLASLFMFKKRQGDGPKIPEPLVGSRLKFEDDTKFVVPLDSINAQNLDQTGGKGQSLAILASLQDELDFKVPNGFVVTAKAMDENFRSNVQIRGAIANLKMSDSMEKIKRACEIIQDLIMQTPFLEDLQQDVSNELASLKQGKDNLLVAVRSSGVAEDSETSSAAGQNETFLGCRSNSEILTALRKCWASLYSFRSVEYRRNRGMDVETTMGVVIQEMIDSRIAGVLFTCDLDGNPSRIRITSNFGLGESIVSGDEGGDVVMVKRTWDNTISIESAEANLKKTKITLNKEHTGEVTSSGTKNVVLSEANSKSMSITDEEVLVLAKVATQLEQKYGRHLDIEWAFEEKKLVLLQARPVTFLENWTDYELEHEFDNPVMCDKNIYTTANVKEVIPGAITPLTNSTICAILDKGIALARGYPKTSRRFHIVSMRHHIFMDFFNVLVQFPPEKVGLQTQAIDYSVCGHPVTTQAMLDRARLIHGRTTKLRQVIMLWDMLKCCWRTPKLIKTVKNLTSEPIRITESTTLKDILKEIDYHLEKYQKVVYIHSEASRASSFYQMSAMNILGSETDGNLTAEQFTQIALVFSSGSGVISAEIPAELEAIASAIRNSSRRNAFIMEEPETLEEWLPDNIPEAAALYATFIADHGHRSFREFELKEFSWETKPSIIMKMLQKLVKMNDGIKKTAHVPIDQVIQQLRNQYNRRVMRFLIRKCRIGVAHREKSKSEIVRQVDVLRGGFRILGERLQKYQYLPNKELMYFLTYEEIKALIATRDPVLITKAMRRSRLYPTWNEYKFVEMNEGRPIPSETRRSYTVNYSGTLSGTPVCAGISTGRCCAIENLAHIDQLHQGDILITHGTDVGWTPYFPMLSGIVTELGGLISHGAVIAREYGIPCIIGVERALDNFRTGDEVILDATKGTISKIRPECPC